MEAAGLERKRQKPGAWNTRFPGPRCQPTTWSRPLLRLTAWSKVLWSGARVAGISAVGHGVLHFLSAAVIMAGQGWTREQVRDMIFAHPSLDKSLRQALLVPRESV